MEDSAGRLDDVRESSCQVRASGVFPFTAIADKAATVLGHRMRRQHTVPAPERILRARPLGGTGGVFNLSGNGRASPE